MLGNSLEEKYIDLISNISKRSFTTSSVPPPAIPQFLKQISKKRQININTYIEMFSFTTRDVRIHSAKKKRNDRVCFWFF